ncbi:ATP-binding protein [Paenibacillus mucilaginosus]|uniref:histidine kinase n=1 Tax=Paenibacillus mucilaginosus (strain KNP414) TaxID=1036673 RepID=F8FGM7_PAEMK|nr:sensor histidine kinase [Paenibacillus mucilaginosus]AEI45404.1 DctS2 [Paenibacillus mucilaginosus KNP414]MCG7217958.1 sensor histidine kinase [Paenibacillus mucilaginosus]WDM26846.1 sensor histidine kinase [Paenibacillus mucilaginosus]
MLQRLRIGSKIAILSFGIVLFSLLIGGTILLGTIVHLREEELGRRLLVTARTVAQMPEIRDGLRDPRLREGIQPAAERIRIINDATYVVVMDMNRFRQSHPVESLIGSRSAGEDEGAAFAEHTYLSKGKGDLGTVLRAFVPVMDENHVQIGVALVGRLMPTIPQIISGMTREASLVLLLSLPFGLWGSWKLAQHIKQQMFELEPQEIARLLVERTATFHAMHEGVIAIDKHEAITIFNDKAKEMLGIQGEVIGRPIREVIPDTRLPEILAMNHPVYNQELMVRGARIMSNRVPITVGGETVGAVAIFQDRTEVTRMAEELTGVRAFVDALRVQNHEYMNKLHTIGGLIQLGRNDKALDYLFEITERREELTGFLSARIKDESIGGLLLGKISRGQELGIEVTVDRQSRLDRFPPRLDQHDLVIVLGNLIENAFDALAPVERDKRIFVSIEQDEEILSLLVEDNGTGIEEPARARIFDRGFTTKGGSDRGIGLHLVAGILHKGGGELSLESTPGEGTSITVTFPMMEEDL